MKHQQVSVDYWAMGKTMLIYGILSVLGWFMLRLVNAVFTLPQRLRTQQEDIQSTLQELQKRFPDLNITEDDLKNAEQELEKFAKEADEKENIKEIKELGTENIDGAPQPSTSTSEESTETESKKTI